MEKVYNGDVVGEEIPAWKALETIINGWIRKRLFDEDLLKYHALRDSDGKDIHGYFN